MAVSVVVMGFIKNPKISLNPIDTHSHIRYNTQMNKHEIIKPLRNGICEITIADENGIEHTLMATKAPQHLPDGVAELTDTTEHRVWVFNVNTESQQEYAMDSIVNVEQLTGEGAECTKRKLQASDDYLESIGLFSNSDDDLDAMEHPEL